MPVSVFPGFPPSAAGTKSRVAPSPVQVHLGLASSPIRLLTLEDEIDPIVAGVEGAVRDEGQRRPIAIKPVTARRGGQRPVGMGSGEVGFVSRILSLGGVVRGDVGGVGRDADRARKIDLLPTTRRLVGEGGVGEPGA